VVVVLEWGVGWGGYIDIDSNYFFGERGREEICDYGV
jgi:hypothetical protein